MKKYEKKVDLFHKKQFPKENREELPPKLFSIFIAHRKEVLTQYQITMLNLSLLLPYKHCHARKLFHKEQSALLASREIHVSRETRET